MCFVCSVVFACFAFNATAEAIIPSVVELEEIKSMLNEIDKGNNPYYLEQRIKNQNNSSEMKKYYEV